MKAMLTALLTLTAGPRSQSNTSPPIWSPDGSRIAFVSLRNGNWGMFSKRADGTGNDEMLIESETGATMPDSWSPDGRSLVYQLVDATFGKDLWLLSLNGDRKTIPLMADPNRELNGQISPDGKWIAFANYSELVANEWGAGSIVHADCEQSANNYLLHPF